MSAQRTHTGAKCQAHSDNPAADFVITRILHEKLLCHRSRFFRNVFYNKNGRKNTVYGLPDEEDEPFKMFVGWLYSERVPAPKEESDLSPLLDVYLMAEKWEIKRLIHEVLDAVRRYYHDTDTWPSLRRVQYIYSNTENDSPMRQLLVSCVARMLVTGNEVPKHWEQALQKNGQLAVDIIRAVQKWHFKPEEITYVIKDSGSHVLISHADMLHQLRDAIPTGITTIRSRGTNCLGLVHDCLTTA